MRFNECSRCGMRLGDHEADFVSCACVPSGDPVPAAYYEAKRDHDKPRPSLMPWGGLAGVIEVAEFGARKYSPHGWKWVPDASERYREALLRHALAFAEHADARDEETGLLHLQHLAWNALALLALRFADERLVRGGDDV